MSKTVDFEVSKLRKKDEYLCFSLEFEDGAEIHLEMNPDLAYQFAHKIQKAVEKANGIPVIEGEGNHYAMFLGMRD